MADNPQNPDPSNAQVDPLPPESQQPTSSDVVEQEDAGGAKVDQADIAALTDAARDDAMEQSSGESPVREPAESAAAPSSRQSAESHTPQSLDLPDFSASESDDHRDISILRDVNLRVQIELGRTNMYIEDVLRLSEGSVVELDNLAGDPVDVVVNGRLIARGEVLVLSDNFCVRISEIIEGPQNMAVA